MMAAPLGAIRRWVDTVLNAEFLWVHGTPPRLPAHHHPAPQVGLVRSGRALFEIGGRRIDVRAPALVVVGSRVPHRVVQSHTAPHEYVQAELRGGAGAELRTSWTGRVVSDLEAVGAFEALVAASYGEGAADHRLQRLARLVEVLAVEAPLPTPLDPVLRRAIMHLERNPNRSVDLDELARVACVSRATLVRRFRAQLGTSPGDYHLSIRVEAACQAVDAGMDIASAALRGGFCDQSHLARRARPLLAMPPGDWQRRRRVD